MNRLLMAVLVLSACADSPPTFICTTANQCAGGLCIDDACAFASPNCQSGYRFDSSANSGRGGKCTEAPADLGIADLAQGTDDLSANPDSAGQFDFATVPSIDFGPPDLAPPPDLSQPIVSFDVVASPTLVTEHQSFSVHLIAHTSGGAILTTYSGGLLFSSDWGDVNVATPPVFLNGQADATISLNRETNATNGLAHVTAKDGGAQGVSQGMTVNAPDWTPITGSFGLGSSGTWDDTLVQTPSLVLVSGTYNLFYKGSGSVGTQGIGRATSTDLSTWARSSTAVFVASASGWDTGPITDPGVRWDGNHFIMTYYALATQSSGGFATSTDGISWARPAGPMVTPGAVAACGKIEDAGLVVESNAGHYTALAFAHSSTALVICELSSTDSGATWPVASVNVTSTIDNGAHYMDAFVKDGSVYRFWHYGHYYTSTDAVNWVLSPKDPVSPYPATVVWNAAKSRYEGLTDAGSSIFSVITRP